MTTEFFSSDEIYEAINTFVLHESAQTGIIAYELLSNLNEWVELHPSDINKNRYIANVKRLINELRGCHIADVGDTDRLLYLPLDDFKLELSQLPEDKQKDIKSTYDHLWYHNSIAGLINSGKINDHTTFKMLSIDNLETVARIYVYNRWMKSRTLDWLLLDSMLFAETAEFARLTNNLPSQKFWNIMGYSVWQMIKFAFTEGFALAFTAIISGMVDSTQGTNFWIIFATITIIRWLNPIKVEHLKLKAKGRILLSEMIGFYDSKFTTMDFNPRLIKELLYDLEKKGASFSPWVYHVLDHMISN